MWKNDGKSIPALFNIFHEQSSKGMLIAPLWKINQKKRVFFFVIQTVNSLKVIMYCLFIYSYLNWHLITISYRKCFCRIPCRKVFWSNTGYFSLIHLSDHANQIDIWQFGVCYFVWGFFSIFFPFTSLYFLFSRSWCTNDHGQLNYQVINSNLSQFK